MSERAGRTQGVGEYCKRGLQWILSNWNSGIPPIIGVAVWISASPWSRQLGAPSVLGRNGVIQLRLGHIIEYAEYCSTLLFWADWARSSWRKTLVKICIMGRYFRICGCQNWVQGPRDRVYTVERRLDRFYTLGMVRFPRLLGFHQDFQSQKPLRAPKMDSSGDKCKVLSIKELSYDLVVLIEVRKGLSVSVCMVGLTLVAVVVVEIWGEISPLRGIWGRSQWGEWYGVPTSDSIVL